MYNNGNIVDGFEATEVLNFCQSDTNELFTIPPQRTLAVTVLRRRNMPN